MDGYRAGLYEQKSKMSTQYVNFYQQASSGDKEQAERVFAEQAAQAQDELNKERLRLQQ